MSVIVGVRVGGGVSVGSVVSIGESVAERVGSFVFVAVALAIDEDSVDTGFVVGVVDVQPIRSVNNSNITNIGNDLFNINTLISFTRGKQLAYSNAERSTCTS